MSDDIVVYTGVVIWFSKGIGFIKQNHSETDIFVHFSDIDSTGYRVLYQDQKVSYQIGKNKRDQDKAVLVKVVK